MTIETESSGHAKLWPLPATCWVAIFAAVTLALITFRFRYAALQDLPEWIYQGYVFNELVAGVSSLQFEIKNFPVPYSLAQLFVSACLLVASPIATSKIVVAAYALAAFIAARRLISRYRLDPLFAWPVLTSIILLNSTFLNGYIGFQSGLLILLFYLTLAPERKTHPTFILAFSLLAFFAHGWSYVALLAFVGANALQSNRIFRSALCVAPSLCLLAWYEFKNIYHQVTPDLFGAAHINIVAYKIYTLLKVGPYQNPIIGTFNAAEHFGAVFLALGLAINAVFVLTVTALAVTVLQKNAAAICKKPEFFSGIILLVFATALPKILFGTTNPGERIIYPALLALIAAIFENGTLPLASNVALNVMVCAGLSMFGIGVIADREVTQPDAAHEARSFNSPITAALFGHRMLEMERTMTYAEAIWQAHAPPTQPLAFETALIGPKGLNGTGIKRGGGGVP